MGVAKEAAGTLSGADTSAFALGGVDAVVLDLVVGDLGVAKEEATFYLVVGDLGVAVEETTFDIVGDMSVAMEAAGALGGADETSLALVVHWRQHEPLLVQRR